MKVCDTMWYKVAWKATRAKSITIIWTTLQVMEALDEYIHIHSFPISLSNRPFSHLLNNKSTKFSYSLANDVLQILSASYLLSFSFIFKSFNRKSLSKIDFHEYRQNIKTIMIISTKFFFFFTFSFFFFLFSSFKILHKIL